MKKLVSVALILTMVFAMAIPAFGAATPVPGKLTWDVKYKGAPSLPAFDSPRDNASGDKIPSNAHSADFPGLYFYWDDKQKDDGVLLVLSEVFDLFKDGKFILTAKNANAYWGYEISPATGTLVDGVYTYGIPKAFMYYDKKGKLVKEDLKNINMVFIDGEYKDAEVEIIKNWFDEDGAAITDVTALNDALKFNNGYELGVNTVKITDYKSAWFGKKITITETAPAGYKEIDGKTSQSVTVKWNAPETVTFNNQKQYAYIEIVKVWLDQDGEEITDEDILAELEAEFAIDDAAAILGLNKVKEGTYKVSETGSVAGYTLVGDEDQEITVAAGETKTVTFYNQEDEVTPLFGLVIEKWVNGEFIRDWADEMDIKDAEFTALLEMMSFKLYKLLDEDTDDWEWIVDGWLSNGGTITFGLMVDFAPGDYKLVETLENGGEDIFLEADPYYFSIEDEDFEGIFENTTIPPSDPEDVNDKIPSRQHFDRWWNGFGILAVGGNTSSDNDYYIAFGVDFWDKYESATLGFGTKNSMITAVFTYESGILVCDNPSISLFNQDDDTIVDFGKHHYTTNDTIFNIKVGAYFANPHGSGAMQIWLLQLQPK